MVYKILDSVWYCNGMFNIGVVAIDSNGHGWKCYIGLGEGDSKPADEQIIAGNGMPTGKEMALALFPELNPDEYRS